MAYETAARKEKNQKIDSGNGNCCGETLAGRGYLHFSARLFFSLLFFFFSYIFL
jgi:hypothetical protein